MNTIDDRLAASDPARRDEQLLPDDAAADMLAAIMLDDNRAPRRSRRRKAAIGGAVLFLALAGTAYASGLVPDIVRDHLTSIDSKDFPLDVDGARRVASVNEGRDALELYEAPAPDRGKCWGVVSRSPAGDYSHETGVECFRGPITGPSTIDEGNSEDGYTIYGSVPRKATLVELLIDGRPRRKLVIDNGYIIAKTGPAAWEKGYELVIRDRSGRVIGHGMEGEEPCDLSAPAPEKSGYDSCAGRR